MKIYNEEKILKEAVDRCLEEMYYFAQPSVENMKEAIEKEGDSEEEPFFQKHYLSSEDCKYILNKYINIYHLNEGFKNDCNIIIEDMLEGCYSCKEEKNENDVPVRLKLPKLSELIGEDNTNKVIDFIRDRQNFYRFDRFHSQFYFTIINVSPMSNKEKVIDYWKSKGIDITIEDRDPEYNYERFYLGYTEEEIKQLIKDEENELAD